MFKYILSPFALIYSLISRIRNFLFDSNLLKSKKAVIPTIAIGNLTVGGTGKTPFTIYLAQLLKKNFKIAIVSRGYKRKSSECKIFSQITSYKITGDEPKLISTKTSLPIGICKDRLKIIQTIKTQLPDTQLIILDDALQYRKLSPNATILLIDCNHPVYNDIFLPAGKLRDNKYRINQFDYIIFTKCPKNLSKQQAEDLIQKHKIANHQKVFFSYLTYPPLYNPFNNQKLNYNQLHSYTTLLVTGIANPEPLKKNLISTVYNLIFLKFPDHHDFSANDLKKIFLTFVEIHSEHKIIITTEKDWVKLQELNLPSTLTNALFIAPVEVNFLFNQQNILNLKIQNHGRELISKNRKGN